MGRTSLQHYPAIGPIRGVPRNLVLERSFEPRLSLTYPSFYTVIPSFSLLFLRPPSQTYTYTYIYIHTCVLGTPRSKNRKNPSVADRAKFEFCSDIKEFSIRFKIGLEGKGDSARRLFKKSLGIWRGPCIYVCKHRGAPHGGIKADSTTVAMYTMG